MRVLALLALILTAAACLPVPDAPPLDLAIVHANDTWGYVRPCG
jgi:2',3'-cyclic-nucleotide 2'-phosphodiesterase (5'-nucleotidase family)